MENINLQHLQKAYLHFQYKKEIVCVRKKGHLTTQIIPDESEETFDNISSAESPRCAVSYHGGQRCTVRSLDRQPEKLIFFHSLLSSCLSSSALSYS